MTDRFAEKLLHWFDLYGRKDLPWQQNIHPYRVWVSEIMLQQTQVSTVIPYFERFMASFPDVQSLANAELDQVLHHWTGLGYYARARNLHRAAQIVVTECGGEFPDDVEALQQLPGIGRSTAGAICAIAHQKQAAILDGNVKRVLARYHAIAGWPGQSSVLKQLWEQAELHTPSERIADYTQAIMDLGATVCTRSKPDCDNCPLADNCQALAIGNQADFPGKKPRKEQPVRRCLFLVIRNPEGDILLERRPANGLWGGLWVFPQCPEIEDIHNTCDQLGCTPKSWELLSTRRHTFSHFHLDYQPALIEAQQTSQVMDSPGLVWYNPASSLELGTAQPVRQLLQQLTQ
ncbi:A/G-specific adenine glycosylase [Porticoccus litoralis]|uniref:Adenine DNA glycosylase n=1 Tax=Porticoccus litoralis TaxID=434086 RepID=A0AAW8B0N6_9GAMM|nr:A/G-specific adenine glycosylase [Porticoccus litoralis]MDP1519592.1 A/G-specific adenine glycosylase [Porticoccus litoralis]